MNRTNKRTCGRQRGVVLVSTLLLLIVMTIFAMSMFRSVGVQEMVAGNVREKQRSLQVAQDALQYAEYYISTNAGNGVFSCPTAAASGVGVLSGNLLTNVVVCANPLATPNTVPWGGSGTSEVGYSYNPGNGDTTANIVPTTSAGPGTYNLLPRFYIWDVGASIVNRCGEIYQVDAWSYAATTNTKTEVESKYVMLAVACNPII